MILHIVGSFLNKEKLELIMARNAAPPQPVMCHCLTSSRAAPWREGERDTPTESHPHTSVFCLSYGKYSFSPYFFYLNAFVFENELRNEHDLLT